MSDRTITPDEAGPSARIYRPPQKLLVACPGCGATVLRGLMIDGRVKKQTPPLTPIFGETHRCPSQHA